MIHYSRIEKFQHRIENVTRQKVRSLTIQKITRATDKAVWENEVLLIYSNLCDMIEAATLNQLFEGSKT